MLFNPFLHINTRLLVDAQLAMSVYCSYDDDDKKDIIVRQLSIELVNDLHVMLGAMALYKLIAGIELAPMECINDLATRIITIHSTDFLN